MTQNPLNPNVVYAKFLYDHRSVLGSIIFLYTTIPEFHEIYLTKKLCLIIH